MQRLPERFEKIGLLGEGGMGIVHEVYDRTRGEVVALKTIREPTGDAVYRLKREFRALANLEHPNLVRLFDLFVDSDHCFVTMEIIRGQDLVSWAASRVDVPCFDGETIETAELRRFDEATVRAAIAGVATGLEALHGAALLHRDLKPSNVMVTNDGRVVILDFGLVADAHAAAQQTVAGSVVGTIAYMAPEQARGEVELTTAVDTYALGIMLYELLRTTLGGRCASSASIRLP